MLPSFFFTAFVAGVCLIASLCDLTRAANCEGIGCYPPPCVDNVLIEGDCCYSCPNGPNCDMDGTPLKLDGLAFNSIGQQCSCSYTTSHSIPSLTCIDLPSYD
ncbi:brorin [Biomphalaria pfeifferi]|uniref:Brorin n=1 Tax=Biomphalaria pfeifferi TaxID=112525 RepID=A0AAD8BUK0_BIOPF|nr:brorin [Biomphalaria pfeifferi]